MYIWVRYGMYDNFFFLTLCYVLMLFPVSTHAEPNTDSFVTVYRSGQNRSTDTLFTGPRTKTSS
jgi:hypothetical protein